MQFEKLNVLSAYQVVSRELRRLILDGGLKAGDVLPAEVDLAERFGVNRSTVREGIRQLENEGLLRREGRKRLTVSRPGSNELAPRASRALVLHQVTFRELWEAALVLEPACAALCAQCRSEGQVADLRANLEATRGAAGDASRAAELDRRFHALIGECARNKALLLAREPVGLLLYPAFEALSPHLPQAVPRLLTAHEHILRAIAEGNAAEAELWMRKHIADFRRGWELAGFEPDAPVDLPRHVAEA